MANTRWIVASVAGVAAAGLVVAGVALWSDDDPAASKPTQASQGSSASPGSPVEVSEFAASLIGDGVVTRDEIEQARAATIECFAAEGMTAEFTPVNDRLSTMRVDSGAPRAGESQEAADARWNDAATRCVRDYLQPVDLAWLRTTAPSDEELQQAFRDLQVCTDVVGVSVAAPTPQDLTDLARLTDDTSVAESTRKAVETCLSTYSVATATGGA